MKRRDTHLVTSSFALACTAFLTGCPEPPNTGSDRAPYRDGWRMEAQVDFIHLDADGVSQIFDLTVGGRESNDNFANRGDVIVNFDGPANQILVEMRRFTFAQSEEAAQDDFDDLSLWAFTSGLGRPQDQDPEDDCIDGGWQNGCDIRVYYDGLSQLRRSGADLRVTLPPDYRQQLAVITQDNVEDADYFNRGNVCVSNLFASVNVETESGNVWVSLNRETYEAPKCSPAQIEACETWTNAEGEAAPWAPECDCIAVGGGEFGRVEVENRDATASDIVIDIPAGLWAAIRAENEGDMQEAAGDHCDAEVTVTGADAEATGNDFPWQANYTANFPGEPAIRGAGFSIRAVSNSCSPVASTEDPADFVGVGNGDEQESAERGNIQVCNDCIVQSCNELIP